MAATGLQVGEIPPPLANALTAKYDVLVLPIDAGREDFLVEHGASVRAIVDAGQAPIDAKLMEALPNLGAIIHWPDGYETIDIDAARRLGIGVSNTAEALTDAVADAAVGLILMTVRSFGAAERYARAGRWSAEGPYPLARDVTGSRVGILGLGHIGSAIAHRLAGFNCAISYHNRRQLPNPDYPYAPSAVDLAKSVEVLVVAAAGSKNAPPLVCREVLEALGPDGYLINIARGSVVDEEALVDLWARGRLAAAAPSLPPWLSRRSNPWRPTIDRARRIQLAMESTEIGRASCRERV